MFASTALLAQLAAPVTSILKANVSASKQVKAFPSISMSESVSEAQLLLASLDFS
jgi:hypothetical protein